VAIDADTKLVPSFMVGSRGSQTGKAFMDDLASRLANRGQHCRSGHTRSTPHIPRSLFFSPFFKMSHYPLTKMIDKIMGAHEALGQEARVCDGNRMRQEG